MRIAVYHNQPSGGARRSLHGFIRELRTRRHTVDVFTLTTSDQDLLRDDDVASSTSRLPYSRRPPIRFGLFFNDIRRFRDLADLRALNRRVASLIDEGAYDVTLVEACRFTYAPYVLDSLATSTAFYCQHGPWRLEPEWEAPRTAYERARRIWHLPFERSYERRLVSDDRALVRRADIVITNSNYTRRRIRDAYGVDAVVCPPGIDIPERVSEERGAAILSVGVIEEHKGFDFVVDALALLPPPTRPALRIVANDGNARVRESLERRARDKQVDLRIAMRIDDDALGREYARAAVFAYGAHQEPLGLAPLEAMAHALPVVAVAEGGVRETVVHQRTGFLTERDTGQFATRLAELISSPELRHNMGQAGRARARSWAWPERAALLEAQLAALASRKRGIAV